MYKIQDRKRAVELYRSGRSLLNISVIIGCGEETVRLWLQAEGVKRRSRNARSKRAIPALQSR